MTSSWMNQACFLMFATDYYFSAFPFLITFKGLQGSGIVRKQKLMLGGEGSKGPWYAWNQSTCFSRCLQALGSRPCSVLDTKLCPRLFCDVWYEKTLQRNLLFSHFWSLLRVLSGWRSYILAVINFPLFPCLHHSQLNLFQFQEENLTNGVVEGWTGWQTIQNRYICASCWMSTWSYASTIFRSNVSKWFN